MSQYDAQWHRFRRLTRCGIAALLTVLITAVGLLWVGRYSWGLRVEPFLFTLAFGSMITLMVLGVVQSYFRCPRCTKLFSVRGWTSRPSIRRRCVHCGLRLYE
jgi:hypothetical protein